MFENKFNSKKVDPLVEAAKGAMREGEIRRQAINAVNEVFGVFNRNAVIRENLAAYDTAIEEAYKCMKEGEKWEGSKEDKAEDAKLAKKHGMSLAQWEKSEADKKHDKKEKCDEAKLADKDYDKDGKIESPKDEVWGSRFRAAKKAGKMEEGLTVEPTNPNNAPSGSSLDMSQRRTQSQGTTPTRDSMSSPPVQEDKTLSPKQKKMAAVAGNPKKIDAADLKALRHGAKINEKKMWEGSPMDSDVVGGSAVTKDNKPVVSPTASQVNTSGPSAADKAGLASKISAMREAKLDEISAKLATRYTKKSFKDMKQAADFGDTMSIRNRAKGIGMASKKLTGGAKVRATEEALDEATRKHFRQHAADISKISDQEERNKAASSAADTYARLNPRFDHAKFHAAAGSTAHQPKKMEEAVYSAKAARAGRDVGKPGKMFSKIAAKAGKKYGSKERGAKVAGAILAKIRAKHMKEDHE